MFNSTFGKFTVFKGRSGRCCARILFDDNLLPTEYFRHGETVQEVIAMVVMDFPFVEFVSNEFFFTELDHIKLFGCRSDALSYELPVDEMPTNRLTDEQILGILDHSDKVLDSFDFDKLKENADALLSSSDVEKDPWLTN